MDFKYSEVILLIMAGAASYFGHTTDFAVYLCGTYIVAAIHANKPTGEKS